MTNANEPAFPELTSVYDEGDDRQHIESRGGLTKREYFAAMAMQGMLANRSLVDAGIKEVGAKEIPRLTAITAMKCADALLLALEQKGGAE